MSFVTCVYMMSFFMIIKVALLDMQNADIAVSTCSVYIIGIIAVRQRQTATETETETETGRHRDRQRQTETETDRDRDRDSDRDRQRQRQRHHRDHCSVYMQAIVVHYSCRDQCGGYSSCSTGRTVGKALEGSSMVQALTLSCQSVTLVLRVAGSSFCKCAGEYCEGEKCSCSKSFTVPNECIKQIGPDYYVELSRKNNSIRALLSCLISTHDDAEADDPPHSGVFGKIAVIDQLAVEQELAIRMLVAECTRQQAERLSKRWRRHNRFAAALLRLPEVIEVASPLVADIPQCQLRMLSERNRAKGPKTVFVQLTSESITWLCNAISQQVQEGCHASSHVAAREKRRKLATDALEAQNSDIESESDSPDGEGGRNSSAGDEHANNLGDEQQSDSSGGEEPEETAKEQPANEEPKHEHRELLSPEPPAMTASSWLSSLPQRAAPQQAETKKTQGPEKKQLTLSAMFGGGKV